MTPIQSFTCPNCGRTSYNPYDVRERYCGYCHVFVDDPATAWPAGVVRTPPPRGSFLDWQSSIVKPKGDRMTNQFELVQRLYAEQPPERTIQSALDFTVRFCLASPPAEAAGLLLSGGDNVLPYPTGTGPYVKAGRICYPDGHIVKILIDVPGTNAPSWQDSGELVDRARYMALRSAAPPAGGTGGGNAAVHPETQTLLDRLGALAFEAFTKMDTIEANLRSQIAELKAQDAANTGSILERINQVVTDSEKTLSELLPALRRII